MNAEAWLSPLCLGLACAVLGAAVLHLAPLPARTGGVLGMARERALASSSARRVLDPVLRQLGACVGCARTHLQAVAWCGVGPCVARLHAAHSRRLQQSGFSLGLRSDEMLAACGLSLAVGCALVWVIPGVRHTPLAWLLPTLAAVAPELIVNEQRAQRFRHVQRDLPAALDLAGLCALAGLDFQAALQLVVRESPVEGALARELLQVLREIRLGSSRQQALEAFRQRTPVAPVVDLVNAVIEAQKRGAPLAETLSTQAKVARQKRSVQAEELATRAGVLLLVPLMMLVGSVLILLIGPFLAGGLGL